MKITETGVIFLQLVSIVQLLHLYMQVSATYKNVRPSNKSFMLRVSVRARVMTRFIIHPRIRLPLFIYSGPLSRLLRKGTPLFPGVGALCFNHWWMAVLPGPIPPRRRILKQEIKAYTAAMTRIISGSRPYWSRLRGDPGGRETHYYNKLLTIIPRHDSFGAYLDMLLAASKIQRAFRHYMKIKRIQSTWRTPVAELRNLKRTETRAKTATTRPRRRSMETPQRGEGRMPVEASLSGSSLAACGAWADMLKELEVCATAPHPLPPDPAVAR